MCLTVSTVPFGPHVAYAELILSVRCGVEEPGQ